MVDSDSYPQRLVSEIASPTPQNLVKPSKFCTHFLCKAVPFVIVLVILPLFPSQAPESFNQTIIARNWELLHLLFVGIIVSYGLFSRRRDFETDKENPSKIDYTQTYMSRILQVSSVFDDEVEIPSGSDENKIQSWNSRYFRGDPFVVIAEENSVLDEQRSTSGNVGNKPLRLPIRSLRSPVSDPDVVESASETSGSWGSHGRSSSRSKGGSSLGSDKTRNTEIGDLDPLDLEEELMDSVVLPSPIPWRSRSGRMEMKEVGVDSLVDESEFDLYDSRSFQSPIHWSSSHSNSTSSSPTKFSPSPSLSPELRAKNVEDLENTTSDKSSPPMTPPINDKSPPVSSNFCPTSDGFSSEMKNVMGSFKEELKDFSRSSRRDMPRGKDKGTDYLKSEVKPRTTHIEGPSKGKSVRTIRASEPFAEARQAVVANDDRLDEKMGKSSKEAEAVFMVKTRRKGGFDQLSMSTEKESCDRSHPTTKLTPSLSQELKVKGVEDLGKKKSSCKSSPHLDEFFSEKKDVKGSLKDESKDLNLCNREDMPSRRDRGLNSLKSEVKSRTRNEGSSKGKSVRTIRAGEATKARELGGVLMEEKTGKKSKEVETVSIENPGRRIGGFDQMPMSTEKQSAESPCAASNPTSSKYKQKEKRKIAEKVILESEEYSSNQVDDDQGILDAEEAFSNYVSDAGSDPNEVNKKADEFIAKFREQIRLQRINSIKRSSGKHSCRNSSR